MNIFSLAYAVAVNLSWSSESVTMCWYRSLDVMISELRYVPIIYLKDSFITLTEVFIRP